MDPVTLAKLGLSLGSLASGISGASKQEKALEEARKKLLAQQQQALDEQRTGTRRVEAMLDQERRAARAQLSARDPFMEQAVSQGTLRTIEAERRKREMASGLQAQRVGEIATDRAIMAARAQGLMARQSLQLQRQEQLGQAVRGLTGQMAQVSQAGLQAQADIRANFGQQISQLQLAQAQQPDPLATFFGGTMQGILSAEGGADWLFGDWFGGGGDGPATTSGDNQ